MTEEKAAKVIRGHIGIISYPTDERDEAFYVAVQALEAVKDGYDTLVREYCKEHGYILWEKDASDEAEKALKRQTGEWIDHQDGRWIYAKCSECGTVHDTKSNYCPSCDADMSSSEKANKCEDAVSREALLDKAVYVELANGNKGWVIEKGYVEDLPSVTRQTGVWIGIDDYPNDDYECNNCGRVIYDIEDIGEYRFCPSCGADMKDMIPQSEIDELIAFEETNGARMTGKEGGTE